MLRGKDVQELRELQRQGMSIQAISELTGWDRKTIRKYMQAAGVVPEYGPRAAQPSKRDAFKPYLEERLRAGVWNARVLLRELRERNYAGSYTILTDGLRPQRSATRVVAVRRFETAPGKQAQGDWGHLGTLELAGQEQKLHGFTFTLGYSRRMVAEAALDQKFAAAAARSGVPADRRSPGRDSLRPHEDGVAGNGRARRDRVAPRVSGLRTLLGIHAAPVPAVSRTDERESGSGREVRAAELSMWLARARTQQPERFECAAARVDLGCSEPARARNDA